MRRSELSADGRSWIVPGSRYKYGKDHVVPLSAAAQTVIASMPDRGEHVFSVDGSRPLSGFNDRKQALDKASGVTGWRLHDLQTDGADVVVESRRLCPTMPSGVWATSLAACAAFMTGSNISTKSVTPSRHWARRSSASFIPPTTWCR